MKNNSNNKMRNAVTLIIVIGAIVSIMILIIWFCCNPCENENLPILMQTIIPLLATWVGAVLAFHFSKENFQAAEKSMRETISNLTNEEKLKTIPVKQAMIGIDKISKLNFDTDEIIDKTLKDLYNDEKFRNKKRYVFVDNENTLKCIIHKSEITNYIAQQLFNGNNSPTTTSVRDFIENGLKDKNTVWADAAAFVSVESTLFHAKDAMKNKTNCEDVFVTRNGKKEESILGLITNDDILEKLKYER